MTFMQTPVQNLLIFHTKKENINEELIYMYSYGKYSRNKTPLYEAGFYAAPSYETR
jgi:hypothetical protein